MGAEFNPATCAHRRQHRGWIPVVAQVIQERRKEISGFLYDGEWRQQGRRDSATGYDGGDYQHQLQHARHARTDRKTPDGLHPGCGQLKCNGSKLEPQMATNIQATHPPEGRGNESLTGRPVSPLWLRVGFWICIVISVAVVIRRVYAFMFPPRSAPPQLAALDALFASHMTLTLAHILPALAFVLVAPFVVF